MWCCQHEQIMIRHVSFTQLLALTFDYQTTTKNHNKYPINLRIASNITTNTKIYYPCVIKMAYFIPNSSSFLIVNSTTIIHSLKRWSDVQLSMQWNSLVCLNCRVLCSTTVKESHCEWKFSRNIQFQRDTKCCGRVVRHCKIITAMPQLILRSHSSKQLPLQQPCSVVRSSNRCYVTTQLTILC
jgi:hypothetical protein